jgi:hypothetical protein
MQTMDWLTRSCAQLERGVEWQPAGEGLCEFALKGLPLLHLVFAILIAAYI